MKGEGDRQAVGFESRPPTLSAITLTHHTIGEEK